MDEVKEFAWVEGHARHLYELWTNADNIILVEDFDDRTAAIVDWSLSEEEVAEMVAAFERGEEVGCAVESVSYGYRDLPYRETGVVQWNMLA